MAKESKTREANGTAIENVAVLMDSPATHMDGREAVWLRPEQITAHPDNPRRRYNLVKEAEMRESVIAQGVIEPLVVRRLAEGTYQLVAGERRWRGGMAAQEKLGQPVWLPCQVRELTDEAALDMMVAENLHREGLHPLDEAEGFNHLLNQVKVNGQSMTIEELSARVGKPAGFIHQRLRLCDLVEAGKELLEQDRLPLGQALEIAKFEPETQASLLGQCLYRLWRDGREVEAVMPLADLRRHIQQKVLLDLKRAPFSIKATNLREDGLACVNCPQRTGAAPTLWEDLAGEAKGPDYCTNPPCFAGKINTKIQLEQVKATTATIAKMKPAKPALTAAAVNKEAATGPVAGETGALVEVVKTASVVAAPADDYQAPLLSDRYHTDGADGILTRYQYTEIKSKADGCEYVEVGVFVDGNRLGQTAKICRQPRCEKHGKQTGADDGNVKTGVTAKRKQEIFNIKVAKATRARFLAVTVPQFGVEVKLLATPHEAGTLSEFFTLLVIARLYCKADWSAQKEICALAGLDAGTLDTHDQRDVGVIKTAEKLRDLTPAQREQLLYGLAVQPFGGDENRNTWHTQEAITEVTGQLSADYRLWDAEARLALAAKKHKPLAQEYLDQVMAGAAEAVAPEFWA